MFPEITEIAPTAARLAQFLQLFSENMRDIGPRLCDYLECRGVH